MEVLCRLGRLGIALERRGERHFVGRLARNLAGRDLAEIWHDALGMQLRLTCKGNVLAGRRVQMAADLAAGIDLASISL